MSEEESGGQESGVVSLGNSEKAGKRDLGKKSYSAVREDWASAKTPVFLKRHIYNDIIVWLRRTHAEIWSQPYNCQQPGPEDECLQLAS